jgi:hypothetical protein
MPAFLLDVTTTALCAHGGKAASTAPMPRVLVMGKPAVTQLPPFVVAGCTFPTMVPGSPPCVSASWATASLRVKAMGQPLLLTTSAAITAPNGVPVSVIPGQTRVTGL